MKVSHRGRAVRYYYGYWAINSGDMMMMLARCKQSAAVRRKLSIELSKTFIKLSALLVGGGVCVLGRAGKYFFSCVPLRADNADLSLYNGTQLLAENLYL